MRTAQDIVADYRKRGYSDERIRALANNRPEPIRSEILALLQATAGQSIVATASQAAEADIMAETCAANVASEVEAKEAVAHPRACDWRLDSDFVRQVHANLAPIQVEHLSAEEF
ncbi:MAG: hypothetical protein N3A66_10360, partial [Planctomycetota bacterium]|nr:hypothetical protein [Planctomycetota bacterium]